MTDALTSIARRQRQDINILYATLSDAIDNAVARHATPGQQMTETVRRQIMAEIDRSLDVIYGRYPGDERAAIRAIVIRDTRLARLAPLDVAVRRWRKAMPNDLRTRVEAGSQ